MVLTASKMVAKLLAKLFCYVVKQIATFHSFILILKWE